ncbi:SEL1-like repeat protein [Shimia biformata]|uniref:SEL1-like repeat protein n=1 Tax=Shimia biformata TaxID=1294299 RepID=UPI00194F1293|nr:SEL1-like repeat protein [Shimia biformata]
MGPSPEQIFQETEIIVKPALFLPLLIALLPGLTSLAALPAGAQSTPPAETGEATNPAPDQTSDETPDQTADPRPEMAAIEQAWQRGDYVFVRQGLKRHAEETGTALAQFRYGQVLLQGRGGPRDIDAAIDWLQKAVAQNHVGAMTLLARVYLSSGFEDQDQVPEATRDPEAAAKLLLRAAPLGGAEAQYYLAQLYRSGTGVEQDLATSFTWMLAAARQDHVAAQYELSRIYSRGLGTGQDAGQAIHWLTQAAENGHLRAQYFLAQALELGNGTEKNMSQAIGWYRRAAEGGLPIAQRMLGTHYLAGNGVEQNTDEGLRWLVAAARAGDPGAMSNLGRAYAAGEGVARDDAEAARWYRRAAEYGLGRAMIALGALHETGRGVPQDTDQAIALYRKALETADAGRAMVRLGQLAADGTLDGRVAPQVAIPWALAAAETSDAAALDWLETQAGAGSRAAQAGLAALYLDGDDDARAAKGAALLQAAAQGGDAAAQLRLGQMHMTGTHVALDYVAAHKWFNIAATLGQDAARDLRETASALMTPEQIAEAQSAARRWFAEEEPQPPETRQQQRETPAPERSQ